MEQTYYKNYKHISKSTDEIMSYIKDRKNGNIQSLRTRWNKFNRQCMGGIEPNAIYTIAGISGSGKSSFVNSLENDLFDLNPKANLVVLSFNWEMISARQVGRKLSYKLHITTSDLYTSITDEQYKKAKEEAEIISKYPIYYVDIPGSVEDVRETILHFCEHEGKDKWVVIILDHILLTKGKGGESERETISKLQYLFMELKKYHRNTIIQISQMNRDIESPDRIQNFTMHFPMRKDIFGSDSIFQGSDYIIVLHRPELLGLVAYGVEGWPTTNLIYLHILKNREGQLGIITFTNNLKYNRIDEVELTTNNLNF
jgi:replicative DNA helicase